MTNTRIFTPKNHLASILSDSAGKTAATLSAASQALLDGMAEGLREKLQIQISRLMAFRAGGEALSRVLELGDVAMNIVEIAGAAGRPQLGEAARGVLAMTDGQDCAAPAFRDALAVHVGAVLLLAADPAPTQEDAEGVLRQLLDVRRFLGVMD
jgi:hypothetical protein